MSICHIFYNIYISYMFLDILVTTSREMTKNCQGGCPCAVHGFNENASALFLCLLVPNKYPLSRFKTFLIFLIYKKYQKW